MLRSFQPENPMGRFGNGDLEEYLYKLSGSIGEQFSAQEQYFGDARNISISVPSILDGNIQEAIEATVQEAMFPLLSQGEVALIPKGAIVAYKGTLSEARRLRGGWGVCDGTIQNGVVTPDLRHKFLRGAGPDTGAGGTGGSELSNVQVAPHEFDITISEVTPSSVCAVLACASGVDVGDDTHTHDVSASLTGSQGHVEAQGDNKPPYYECIWLIMLR